MPLEQLFLQTRSLGVWKWTLYCKQKLYHMVAKSLQTGQTSFLPAPPPRAHQSSPLTFPSLTPVVPSLPCPGEHDTDCAGSYLALSTFPRWHWDPHNSIENGRASSRASAAEICAAVHLRNSGFTGSGQLTDRLSVSVIPFGNIQLSMQMSVLLFETFCWFFTLKLSVHRNLCDAHWKLFPLTAKRADSYKRVSILLYQKKAGSAPMPWGRCCSSSPHL